EVVEVDAGYDQTVAAAADYAAGSAGVLVQDTAWDGYEEVPGWIVDGYSTLFREIDSQLREAGHASPELICVPTGVGSLLQAARAHSRRAEADSDQGGEGSGTAVVSVEPDSAACMGPSLAEGRPVSVATGQTIMSGLNCGSPSSLAWPVISNGLDAPVAVSEPGPMPAARPP